ncbi:condensation domain-containing protein [Lysinibacillus sphaericus]|uniref:Amino acid adenylation enzyme/thioester reductase family protein n=1 Tax=Lysinibacillus sphaericus OT4b.31 TaxID=1285586 RepID=R7ZDR4_LYSSH|nr:condensation domain-containing protein [Lysinibacillus sphaericus]EON72154.1 amino acid adenylation enzyme/thioester reductase family protein [Lysinibacillus sphaericus OT4b.31]
MVKNDKKLPLTPLQMVMLMETLKDPLSDAYWQILSYEIPNTFSFEEIHYAWLNTVKANPALRTKFEWDYESEPIQIIQNNVEEVSVLEVNFLTIKDEFLNIENWFKSKIARLQHSMLDKSQQFYIVHNWKPTKNLLVWVHHHIIMDGWSIAQTFEDFFKLLNKDVTSLESRPDIEPYLNYISDSAYKKELEEYWKNVLSDLTQAETLAIEKSQHVDQKPLFMYVDKELSKKAAENLHAYSIKNRVTTSSVALTIWGVLINRYQQTNKLYVGSTFALRPYQLIESNDMNGMLINTLPVKIDIEDELTLKEVCLQTMDYLQDVSENSGVPYSKLLQFGGVSGDSEIFKTSVIFQNFKGSLNKKKNGDLVHQYGTSSDSLSITFDITQNSLFLRLGWDQHRYEKMELMRILDSLEYIFENIETYNNMLVKNMNLTKVEELYLNNVLNTKQPENFGNFSIQSMLEGHKEDSLAISDGQRNLSYRDLKKCINIVANQLLEEGVQSGDTVALVGKKSIETAIGIFATWTIGAAWCAIDMNTPDARNKRTFEILQPKTSLFLDNISKIIECSANEKEIMSEAHRFNSEDFAYYISTSGSTGEPKIVSLKAEGLSQLTQSWKQFYNFSHEQNVLQLGSWTSDVFLGDLLKAWSTSGCLFICEEDKRIDMAYLAEIADKYNISFLESTPVLVREFIHFLNAEKIVLKDLKTVVVGSDTFRLEEKNEICNMLWKGVNFYNGYGLSECTIESLVYKCNNYDDSSKSGLCPIGEPLPGTIVRIVDKKGNLVAPGMIGELHIGGNQVTKGYVTEDGLATSNIYALDGVRYFRTGDLVRLNANGVIEFYGRCDQQVKIRGYRLELGEVENALLSLQSGMECFVTCLLNTNGENQLIAFISGTNQSVETITSIISGILPDFAIPNLIISLEKLPRNTNGKIDRVSLKKQAEALLKQSTEATNISISGDIVDIVRETWEVVLGKKVQLNRSLFDQGGHSLIALKLYNLLRKVLPEHEFVVGDLFRYPTINRFVEEISARKEDKPTQESVTPSYSKIEVLEKVKQGELTVDEAMKLIGGNRL